MKMSKIIVSALLVLAAGAVQAQQRYELSVKEAVDLAYKNVVELKNAQLDYRIQQAKNNEIKGQALPQVNGAVSANHYLQLPKILFPDATSTAVYSILKNEGVSGTNGPIVTVPAPTMQQVSFQQPWNLSVGATVTQLLFQPDVFVGLQARQTALDLNQAMIDQVKDRIKDSAYQRYYAILIAQKQLDFLDSSIVRLNKLYHDDSLMFKNGFAERLDLDKVQVQLNNLNSTRTTVSNAVNIALAALKFAIGVSQNDVVVLRDTLTVASIKEDILDNSFRYEDRAEIRTLTQLEKLGQLDVKRYQLGWLPTVSLAGNYSVNAMGEKFFTDNNTIWLKSSYIGVNLNLPIFTGFQRKYKVQEAQLSLEKARNNTSYAKQGIDLQQVISRETLTNSLLNLDIQDRNLALALRVYNATKLKFEQGLGSSFEVLQADSDYQMAQSNYFNALYNATIARVGYLYALGKL